MTAAALRPADYVTAIGDGTLAALGAFRRVRREHVPISDEDRAVARALASVALAGLCGLPFMILASVVLGAPVAGPVVIALGYFGAGAAVAAGESKAAMLWMLAVLIGLGAWCLVVFALSEEWRPVGSWCAMLMAPMLAAAPAAVHRLAVRQPLRAGIDCERAAALNDMRCVQRFTPEEALAIVRPDGTLLAATPAGLACLGPVQPGQPVTRHMSEADARRLRDAIRLCDAGASADASLAFGAAKPSLVATLSAGGDGTVSLRLRTAPPARPTAHPPATWTEPATAASPADAPESDLADAVEFALRHSGQAASARGMSLDWRGDAALPVALDRQLGRRLVKALADEVVAAARPGSRVPIAAKLDRGVASLRYTFTPDPQLAGRALPSAALSALADQAGVALIAVNDEDGSRSATLRFVPAVSRRNVGAAERLAGAQP